MFHGIVHGIPWNPVSPHRWIVDGDGPPEVTRLRLSKVTELAVEYRLTATLATGIEWLSSQGLIESVEVPDADTRVDRVVQEYMANPVGGFVTVHQKVLRYDVPRRLIAIRGERWTPTRHLSE